MYILVHTYLHTYLYVSIWLDTQVSKHNPGGARYPAILWGAGGGEEPCAMFELEASSLYGMVCTSTV